MVDKEFVALREASHSWDISLFWETIPPQDE